MVLLPLVGEKHGARLFCGRKHWQIFRRLLHRGQTLLQRISLPLTLWIKRSTATRFCSPKMWPNWTIWVADSPIKDLRTQIPPSDLSDSQVCSFAVQSTVSSSALWLARYYSAAAAGFGRRVSSAGNNERETTDFNYCTTNGEKSKNLLIDRPRALYTHIHRPVARRRATRQPPR